MTESRVPTHREMHAHFSRMFPELDKGITHYGSYGPYSIQLSLTNGDTLVFSYINARNWSLETINRRFNEFK